MHLSLLVMTRRRLAATPADAMVSESCHDDGRNSCLLAHKDGQPVAALLTLRCRNVVLAIGGSDARYHNLGAVPFLFWNAIQEARSRGMQSLDLGRSDWENAGLITFKSRMGAAMSELTYFRYGTTRTAHRFGNTASRAARQLFALMPDTLRITAGKVLYRHLG